MDWNEDEDLERRLALMDSDSGEDDDVEVTKSDYKSSIHYSDKEISIENSTEENKAESRFSPPISPPLCTENYTFLPGCVEQVRSCVSCPSTKKMVNIGHNTTNSDLAARAMNFNMSTVSCISCI
jgi:hypothetical protein